MFAKSFGGGGAASDNVSEQPNKWEHDQNSHGTHVTSTILGYSFFGSAVNGVAPMATVIPVKVLNQNGSGWSSVIARGINCQGRINVRAVFRLVLIQPPEHLNAQQVGKGNLFPLCFHEDQQPRRQHP